MASQEDIYTVLNRCANRINPQINIQIRVTVDAIIDAVSRNEVSVEEAEEELKNILRFLADPVIACVDEVDIDRIVANTLFQARLRQSMRKFMFGKKRGVFPSV